ncbi:MAG: hypothetical protein Q8M65_07155 [Rhodoglobus sp.]|nr:hypothetical protein [Rhodoglobus sp.]
MGICAVKGWALTGSRGDAYSVEVSAGAHDGSPVVRMWRSADGADGFGAMFQRFKADAYRGKRVQLSAVLRTVDVTDRAALCFRVDGPDSDASGRYLAFDNMEARPPVSGTTDWTRYACVLDVPEEATALFISNILSGRGELFWADVRFEVVDDSVPVTDMQAVPALKPAPTNLDFSEA